MAGNSITLQVRPKWPEIPDDYVVWCEGHEIGRIRLMRDVDAANAAWEWCITVPMAVPKWGRGATGSRDAAIKDVGSAWGRLLQETPPDRLQRAWEFEHAAQSRLRQTPVLTAQPAHEAGPAVGGLGSPFRLND